MSFTEHIHVLCVQTIVSSALNSMNMNSRERRTLVGVGLRRERRRDPRHGVTVRDCDRSHVRFLLNANRVARVLHCLFPPTPIRLEQLKMGISGLWPVRTHFVEFSPEHLMSCLLGTQSGLREAIPGNHRTRGRFSREP